MGRARRLVTCDERGLSDESENDSSRHTSRRASKGGESRCKGEKTGSSGAKVGGVTSLRVLGPCAAFVPELLSEPAADLLSPTAGSLRLAALLQGEVRRLRVGFAEDVAANWPGGGGGGKTGQGGVVNFPCLSY